MAGYLNLFFRADESHARDDFFSFHGRWLNEVTEFGLGGQL